MCHEEEDTCVPHTKRVECVPHSQNVFSIDSICFLQISSVATVGT
jgi:hypothetical protein